jgi:hypothetical protein
VARRSNRPPRGITNKQAHYLAHLQRKLGTQYTGNGLTMREASDAIERCREQLGLEPRPLTSYAREAWAKQKRIDRGRIATVERAPKAKARAHAARARAATLPAAIRPLGGDEPTAQQLHDLDVLTYRAGLFIPAPLTRGEAARELARLRRDAA